MPQAYSADMRARVIGRVESGASRREGAEYYDISLSLSNTAPAGRSSIPCQRLIVAPVISSASVHRQPAARSDQKIRRQLDNPPAAQLSRPRPSYDTQRAIAHVLPITKNTNVRTRRLYLTLICFTKPTRSAAPQDVRRRVVGDIVQPTY
jgi:hypothetical protein